MPSQRPFFLSTFFASFRQSAPSSLSSQQHNKHTTQTASSAPSYHQQQQQQQHHSASSASSASSSSTSANASSSPRTISSNSAHQHQHHHHHHASSPHHQSNNTPNTIASQLPLQSPRSSGPGMPIPGSSPGDRRRGSDSSSEGFRDVLGADKWYIGGRTAGGEERFFKLGVVRRVRSNDGLSLDRLSL